MRPWDTEELRIFRDSTRRFLAQEMVPHRERWDQAGIVDRDAFLKLGEAGLLCPGIPEEYGGGGGGRAHEIVVQEEMAHAGLSGGLGTGAGLHGFIVAHYILAYGAEEQKRRWLTPMTAGGKIAAVAMTEPGAGSDLQSIRTSAKRSGNGYVINGAKTFITNGQNADLILTVAKTSTDKGSHNISLLMVEADQASGFRRGRNLEKIGMHAQDTSELFFDDVWVPAENLLGVEEGQGFQQLMVQLAWERLQVAIDAAINLQAAVEMTVRYTKERKAFGRPLFEFQNTQFKLAECATIAAVARSYIDDLIVRLLEGRLDPETAAMAKWWTSDQQFRVMDECLQLHGGYGYMLEYPIARLFANTRVSRIYGGSNEVMKMIIARKL